MLHVLIIALRLGFNFMRDEFDQLWVWICERVATAALPMHILVLMMMVLHVDVLLRVRLHLGLGPALVSI